jgi:predicted PurR-regulated permease PerM
LVPLMRRVREWPRLMAVVVVLAVVLVLIGVVVASAASSGGGGSAPSTSTPLLKPATQDQTALVQSQAKTITRLRSTVSDQHAQITTLETKLKRSRALTRLHLRRKHHHKQHANRR